MVIDHHLIFSFIQDICNINVEINELEERILKYRVGEMVQRLRP